MVISPTPTGYKGLYRNHKVTGLTRAEVIAKMIERIKANDK